VSAATGARWLSAKTRIGVQHLTHELGFKLRVGVMSNRQPLRVIERGVLRASHTPLACADRKWHTCVRPKTDRGYPFVPAVHRPRERVRMVVSLRTGRKKIRSRFEKLFIRTFDEAAQSF
jgi:hypothetical protein